MSKHTDLNDHQPIARALTPGKPMSIQRLPPFRHIRWNPDRAELRRFSIAMLLGFSLLGLLAAWRLQGFGPHTWALWTAGLVLAALGQAPVLGRWTYVGVYAASGMLGYIVSRILLVLMFFLVFTPLAAILRLFGKDVLRLKPLRGETLWSAHAPSKPPASYYRQF